MAGRIPNPLPTEPSALRDLAERLREVREAAGGLTYRDMAKTGLMTASALSQAASGLKYPTWECVEAFLRGCDADRLTIGNIKPLWEAAEMEKKARKAGITDGVLGVRAGSGAQVEVMTAALADRMSMPVSDPAGPVAVDEPRPVKDYQELTTVLREIMQAAGLTVAEVLRRSRFLTAADGEGEVVALRKTTVYDTFKNKTRPSESFIRAFLTSCGTHPAKVEGWVNVYRKLRREEKLVESALKTLQTGVLPAGRQVVNFTGHGEGVQLVWDRPTPTVEDPMTNKMTNNRSALSVIRGDSRPVVPDATKIAADRLTNRRRVPRHRRPGLIITRPSYRIEVSEEMLLMFGVVGLALITLIAMLVSSSL
jgi:hypothetical protein